MDCLVRTQVHLNPDVHAAPWVLFSRVIALGLRGGKASSGGGGEDMEHEGGDGTESKPSSKVKSPTGIDSMTYIQYASWCRDSALERARNITSTRVKVKSLALRCATAALTESCLGSEAHSDLLLSRKDTQLRLDTLNTSTPSDDKLREIPSFISLFMNDTVSMGCACATFTIEDKTLPSLQSVSIEYLQAVVHLFWNSLDPDVVTKGGGGTSSTSGSSASTINSAGPLTLLIVPPERKLLFQFLAQIISALRPSLSVQWHPELLRTAGNLVYTFICGGLLTDKVVIRRLVKALLSIAEHDENYEPRCRFSLDVAGDVSVTQHIIATTNLARLYLLTTPFARETGRVDATVQEAILSMLAPHLKKMVEVWVGISIDSARVLQGRSIWLKSTQISDSRRGGITYSPSVDPLRLVEHFELSLPYVLAAASISGAIQTDQVSPLLAIALSMRYYLKEAEGVVNNQTIGETESNEDLEGEAEREAEAENVATPGDELESLLLASIQHLVKQSNATPLPVLEWSRLIRSFSSSLVTLSTATISSGPYIEQCAVKFALILDIIHQALLQTKGGDDSGLVYDIWECTMTVAVNVFCGVFVQHYDNQNSAEFNRSSMIFPEIALFSSPSNNPVALWWLCQPRGRLVVSSLTAVLTEVALRSSSNPDIALYLSSLLVALTSYGALNLLSDDFHRLSFMSDIDSAICRLSTYSAPLPNTPSDPSIMMQMQMQMQFLPPMEMVLDELWHYRELFIEHRSRGVDSREGQVFLLNESELALFITETGRALTTSWLSIAVSQISQVKIKLFVTPLHVFSSSV
jgi:hypothetical protein